MSLFKKACVSLQRKQLMNHIHFAGQAVKLLN